MTPKKVFCPNCYSGFEIQPNNCNCGYPFNGNDMDKYKFMSIKLKKGKTIQEGNDIAAYSRYILFVIGGLNLLISVISIIISQNNSYTIEENGFNLLTVIYCLILIGLGFYSYKEPYFALLIGFIVMIFMYGVLGFVDPSRFLSVVILRLVFLGSFVYGLIKIKHAENIKEHLK